MIMTVYRNWKRLNYTLPEKGQKCEWMFFGYGYKEPEKGVGVWINIQDVTDLPPIKDLTTGLDYIDDNRYFYKIRGFVDERGTFVSDPKRTIWKLSE
jgi:hypothetical protein